MSFPPMVKDFTVLPVLYKSPSSSQKTTHFLYLREHISQPHKARRNPNLKNGNKPEEWETYPNGRTLFIVNTPPDSTERELRLFFQFCGHVERVILQKDRECGLLALDGKSDDSDEDRAAVDSGDDVQVQTKDDAFVCGPNGGERKKGKKTGRPPPKVILLPSDLSDIPLRSYRPTGSTAYIIFAELGALSRALEWRNMLNDEPAWPLGRISSSQVTVSPFGLAHYVALHAAERPPLDAVKKHADSYVEVYEYNKNISRRENASNYKKGEAIVDEDGFTLVARGGAYGQSIGGGVGVASKIFTREMENDAVMNSTSNRKKKKKKHEKEDFYKFQIHEKRRRGESRRVIPLKDGKLY